MNVAKTIFMGTLVLGMHMQAMDRNNNEGKNVMISARQANVIKKDMATYVTEKQKAYEIQDEFFQCMSKNKKIKQAYNVCLNNPCKWADEAALAYFNKAVDSQVAKDTEVV